MEESDGMKKILLVATGGTIASVEDGRGLAPALGGEELARYVPEIADVCDFDVVQPMNIDSTNMRPADWMRIRDEIVDAYDAYDGFVVLHGTDTMAYTAAALSYLVQGSPKPIVLTVAAAHGPRPPSPTRSSTCTRACCSRPTIARATCRWCSAAR